MVGVTTTTLLLPALNLGNDPSVQRNDIQPDGCGTEYGT